MDLIEEVQKILGLTASVTHGVAVEPSRSAATKSRDAVISRRMESGMENLLQNIGPKGLPLSQSLSQDFLTGRPEVYKEKTATAYRESTREVARLYNRLHRKEKVSGGEVRRLVLHFLGLLKTDRNILVNLAYLPSPDSEYLFTHVINTSLLSMALATAAGYSEEQALDIAVGALLMDVGMMAVPEAILQKRDPLTDAERFEIHKHPMLGADMLHALDGLADASLLAIYQHHERLTGTGYPKQRSGVLIHDFSRIAAITDTYSALVANRNYRRRLIPYKAMEAIIKLGSSGMLDSALIRKFLEALSLFPLGSLVKLRSGRIGKIIHTNGNNFTKPLVALLRDEHDLPMKSGQTVDLSRSREETIIEALDESAVLQTAMDGF